MAGWFGRSRPWEEDTIPRPWDTSRPSLFQFLADHAGKNMDDVSLPDESTDDTELRYAPGALDGVMGHHVAQTDDENPAVFNALSRAVRQPTRKNLAALYALLVEDNTLSFIDDLLPDLADSDIDKGHLGQLAGMLAMEAPDRGAVKVGIAVLGILGGTGESLLGLFHTLGRHDEFTLFSATALSNCLDDPEPSLFALAKEVDGWGRIQIVERLSGTENPEIRHWMLRDGFRNSVMYEYLTQICAESGGLLDALSVDEIDDPLFDGAGDIIAGSLYGGPVNDITYWQDGAEIVGRYIDHAATRGETVRVLSNITAIWNFLKDEDSDWKGAVSRGWTSKRRAAMIWQAAEIVKRPHWRDIVIDALTNGDDDAYWRARGAAASVEVDPWEYTFARQKGDAGHWYHLMETTDEARIERVLELAESQIPMDIVASGASDSMGFGPDYRHHSALQFLVQGLHPFPGKGARWIDAALKSPVISGRNTACRTLSDWGRETWPIELTRALERAIAAEPDSDVRARMTRVSKGEPLEEDPL